MSMAVSGIELVVQPPKVEAALWRRLVFEHDVESKHQLFLRYRGFATAIALSKFRNRPPCGLEKADVEQAAFEALLEAIDAYDPLRNVPFEAFARLRINGAISDTYKRGSESSAQYAYRQRVLNQRIRALEAEAKAEETSALEQLSALSSGLLLGFILEGLDVDSSGEVIDPAPSGFESLAWKQLREKVIKELKALPDQEKKVIVQHYLGGVAFNAISSLMGLSKGRISQLHKQALERLKDRIGKFE